MWLFTRYGFYSLSVQSGSTVVRARVRKHLENLMDRFDPLRGCEIAETPQRDYAYRISVDGDLWPGMVAELAREQTWSNFKSEVARFGGRDGYERALHKIWGVMYDFQEQNKR